MVDSAIHSCPAPSQPAVSSFPVSSFQSIERSRKCEAAFQATLDKLANIYNSDVEDLQHQVTQLQSRLAQSDEGVVKERSCPRQASVPKIATVVQSAVEEAISPASERHPATLLGNQTPMSNTNPSRYTSERYPALHDSQDTCSIVKDCSSHHGLPEKDYSSHHGLPETDYSSHHGYRLWQNCSSPEVASYRASTTASESDVSALVVAECRSTIGEKDAFSPVRESFEPNGDSEIDDKGRRRARVSAGERWSRRSRSISSDESDERSLWQPEATKDHDRRKMSHARTISERAKATGDRKRSDLSMMSGFIILAYLRKKARVLVSSVYFEAFFAGVIITNSIFLGVRVDLSVTHPNEPDHLVIELVEYFYTALFTAELFFRIFADGFGVYCAADKFYWFWLDTFIVGSAILEITIRTVQKSSTGGDELHVSNTRMFRVVRITRIIKIIRIARVVRFVRALRVLVLSIVHTMRSVFWAFVLLLIIIYVFGLVFVQVVTDFLREKDGAPNSLSTFWGTLPRSMFTLYKSISSGISWHEVVTPLADVHELLVALFILFISFTVFAVLNVITGVFCEAAIESARQDHEMMIQQHLAEKDRFVSEMYGIFHLDVESETSMSYIDFESVLKDPKTKARLEVMQLDITDAWELFKLLDTDDSCFVDVEEFVHGCLRLKGMAKAIDIAKLDYETRIRQKRILRLMHFLDKRLCKIQHYLDIPFTTKTLSL